MECQTFEACSLTAGRTSDTDTCHLCIVLIAALHPVALDIQLKALQRYTARYQISQKIIAK